MSLAQAILELRDRTLADLVAAHDYYSDTQFAWNFVGQGVVTCGAFSTRNAVTGTVTSEADLVRKSQDYIVNQLAEATFQQFLTIFESFLTDLLRLWLTAYPHSLSAKTVETRVILEASDRDAIIESLVAREVNELTYRRLKDWFDYLESRARLACPAADEIDRLAEAKASRDVLVHNRGVANKTYLSKSGPHARFNEGERLDIPEPYHRVVWELVCKVVADIGGAALDKAT